MGAGEEVKSFQPSAVSRIASRTSDPSLFKRLMAALCLAPARLTCAGRGRRAASMPETQVFNNGIRDSLRRWGNINLQRIARFFQIVELALQQGRVEKMVLP